MENIKDHALRGAIPMWDWNDEKEVIWLAIALGQFVYNKNGDKFYYRIHRGEEASEIEHSTAMSILKHQKALNDLLKEALSHDSNRDT